MRRLSLYFVFTLSLITVIAEEENMSSRALDLFDMFNLSALSNLLNSIKDVFSVVMDQQVHYNASMSTQEDAHLDIMELAAKYGYNMEVHKTQTEDGYILTMHRIPRGRNGAYQTGVVFLMHGLIDSSDGWVLQGPNKSLGYILADEGYDVWMGNARGNKYSTSHVIFNNTDQKFWSFTWEEIGLYDLPAMIDYTLGTTNETDLYYVGHSQGTTSFYVMASMKPAYNDKVKIMFSLSPVAFMKHVRSPIVRMFSPANQVIAYWLSTLNIYSPSTDFFNNLLSLLCYVMPNCDNILNLVVGNNHNKYFNESLYPVLFSHMPSGSSTLQFVHYGQLVKSGRFCRFDFGPELNRHMYNSTIPPNYDLSKVTVPVVLFYSGTDWLSDPEDIHNLSTKLPKVENVYYIEDYNHLDFLYAYNAKDVVYSHILDAVRSVEVANFRKYIVKYNTVNVQ